MTVVFSRREATPSRASARSCAILAESFIDSGLDFALRARAGFAGESVTVMDRRYIHLCGTPQSHVAAASFFVSGAGFLSGS